MTVERSQRHTKAHRCGICDGADGDPRGKGRRCSGFTSTDGEWVRCSREQHAGSLSPDDDGLYVHRMHGACKCGVEHGPARERSTKIEATYDYCDEGGVLLFQVVRKIGKDFKQRRPDGAGGWIWKLEDTRRVLYRLPELLAAPAVATVYIAEGEKDVDCLVQHGLLSTCNPHGAGKWNTVGDEAAKVLAGRDVVIIADADERGRTHAQQVAAALDGIATRVRVAELPQKDAADFFAAGGDVARLDVIVGVAPTWAPAPAKRSGGEDGAPDDDDNATPQQVDPKQAEIVIQIVCEKADLFHDPKGTPYAVIRLGVRRAVFKLRSTTMRSWIARTVRDALGHCVSSTTIEEALVAIDGIARFDSNERPVHLRVAERSGSIYIDLGDETGACVEVTAAGWSIRGEAPVMFRRPDPMRPLPLPVQGGQLDDLRPFFNAADDDALHLFVAWMVAAMRPGRPFPILALHGEQGTAKSTASRVARALIDPNAAPVRSAPRVEDDLAVASVHSHVVAFDNLSGVQPWLSDALCRLATGGGLSKRTLYSDDDETVLDAIRPVIVNGIDDIANRADLAERCLVLTLQPIPKEKRRDEESFWRDFNTAAPRILGMLLDGVASALRGLPEVQIPELPRMADFAKWTAAAEPGLGLPGGALLAAYERNRARVVDVALDSSPVAQAVRRLLDWPANAGRWEGTPDQCLDALTDIVTEGTRRAPGWPRSASTLSSKLRRSATFLRSVGVDLDLDGYEGRGDGKRRRWRLSNVDARESGVPPVPASPTAENTTQDVGRDHGQHRSPRRPRSEPQARGDDVGTTPAATPSLLGPDEDMDWGRGDAGDEDSSTLLGGRI
jgi:hypothetical protein